MRRLRCLRVRFIGMVIAGWLGLAACPGEGAEEAWRFLRGLRERGYHDMALEYLERMRQHPQCPDDLKEVIDYEAGVTLVAGSRLAGGLREKQLAEARTRFEKFLNDRPEHPLAGTTNTQLANVLVEQGKIKVDLASRPSKSDAEKKQLRGEARQLYQEAQKVFVAAEQRVYEQAKALTQTAEKDARQTAQRDEARRELLQARLYLAGVVYEIGKTYEAGSKQYKDQLTDAAGKYHDLYEKYSRYTAGLYARMQEGRAYMELGETDQAIEILKEMLTIPGGDETARTLKNESLSMLLETYLLPKVKQYGEAAAQAKKWQEGARGAEESSPDGLKIRLLGGKAALAYAKTLEQNDANRKEQLKAARQHLEFVARFPGEFQREAKNVLMDELLGGKVDVSEDPVDYPDAKDRGDFAWSTMVVALGSVESAQSPEDKKKFSAEMNQARDEALKCYHMALGFKSADTSVLELNLIRFRLAYLYWVAQDFYRAAVMGEFLARRYPESMGARQGAEIAVKAYRTLYTQAAEPKQQRTFEIGRMIAMAEYIAKRWPGESVGDEAWMMLLDTAVDGRDAEKAQEYLDRIRPDSPQRGQAELRTGQLLWASYLQQSRKEPAERPPQADLDELAKKAQDTLEQGISRMRKAVEAGSPVDYTLVYSVLSLAQICIGAGRSEDAVTWLDDSKIGPMTLVAAKHPATDQGNFRVETYKAALRAYVGAEQLEKAEETMNGLESLVAEGGDAAAASRLTEIYIMLGRELQEMLKRLRQENKLDEAEQVARGFELFLERISGREAGNNFGSLNWVAETFYSLGASLDPGGEALPAKAKDYYTSAATTYLSILTQIKKDKKGDWAPAAAAASIQVRLAACLRALDEHDRAMKLLVTILKQRENRVDVQMEAARTYQDWAGMEGKSGYYNFAINGGQKQNGHYLVWGWGGIARRVAAYEQFRSTFFEARYSLAVCRLKLARSKLGEEKQKLLEMAEKDITRVHQLYPKMGGQESYDRFDALLKTIQKLRGDKRPAGLGG